MTLLPDHRAPRLAVRQSCHFGEWLQGRMGAEGPVVLVTLQPDGMALQAWRRPAARLAVALPFRAVGFPVAPLVLRRFFRKLGLPWRDQFALRPAFPPGLGTGASTASLIAIARLAGFKGSPEVLARACIAAEGASDPLMFVTPSRLLWASRQGRVVGRLPPVPRAHLLSGFYGPALPTRAADEDYEDISDLVFAWQKSGGLADCAGIASESARRCFARRGPGDDPMATLAKDLGALGWAASHSGAARALIFAPGTVPQHGAALLREAGLRDVRKMKTGGD